MLDCATIKVNERVAELVGQLLAKRKVDRAVGPDEDLGECGLSSLDFVNLMLAVEAEFEIKIPDAEMSPTNFRTLARIEALVARLHSDAGRIKPRAAELARWQ